MEALIKAMGVKLTTPVKEYKERYIIRLNDRIIPLNINEIAYVYSEDKNNYLVTFDEKKYIIDIHKRRNMSYCCHLFGDIL